MPSPILQRPVLRRAGLWSAGALACLILPGCVFSPIQLERETRELRVEHLPASAIEVRTGNGAVEITADPDAPDVRIVADLRAQTIDRLERTAVVAARDDAGVLRISIEWADGKALNSEGCDFEITLPDAHGATVHTSNGAVRLHALAGSASARSSNGRIEITAHQGDVHATTSNGAIVISDPAGAAHASSSNGAIEITNAPSRVDADTSNGRVTIVLTSDSPGPVRAESSNGRIELHVGKAFTGRLSLRTSNGKITADDDLESSTAMRTLRLQKRSGVIEFGQGGDESNCVTSNGAIEVRARRD